MTRTRRGVAAVATVALGAAGALALPLGGGAADASVAVSQSYRVPGSGVFTLRGHGYGHGHGMSQYGAWGAAKQGRTYRQILQFYYPGTRWGTARPRMRVLVSADTTTDVVVSPAKGLRVWDVAGRAVHRLPDIAGVKRWRLNVDGGKAVVGYYTDAWHRYRPGGRATLVGDGQFGADEPMTLWTPSGSRSYRGWLRAASPSRGSSARDTVNVLWLDEYVRGVIPAEMPVSWHPEAVRAQAVAARTYAMFERNQRPDRHWHVCDTTSCQVYRGVSAEDPRGNAAVAATAGQILTHGGSAAFTQFSSSSGGWTSAGSRPYLVSQADPYDGHAGNPVHDWTLRLSAKRIRDAYPAIGRLNRLHVTRREGGGQWGGRVVTVVLDGTKANRTLSGADFRSRFGLRSAWFAA